MDINKNNYEAFFLDYHEGNLSADQVATLLLFIEQHPELKEEFESFENITLENLTSIEFSGKENLKKEITDINKEAYFIGFIENTLNITESNLFDDFLLQNPSAQAELELFRKTILKADSTVRFENKKNLKKNIHIQVVSHTGNSSAYTEKESLLISSIEGILSEKQKNSFENLFASDNTLKEQHKLYQQTLLIPDTSIVFEGKEKLKRKSEKVIPLYYYISAAASVVLFIGIFFFFNTSNQSGNIAKTTIKSTSFENKAQTNPISTTSHVDVQIAEKRQETKKAEQIHLTKQEPVTNLITTPPATTADTLMIVKASKDTTTAISEIAFSTSTPEKQLKNNAVIAEPQQHSPDASEYVSLRELATEKIKEKLLDEATLAVQKKNGLAKKINGWDIAQLVTKGISKLSGKEMELKPHYNDDGSISSYAFSAGEFKILKKL